MGGKVFVIKFVKIIEIKKMIVYNILYNGLIGGKNMSETREEKLAALREKREYLEVLKEIQENKSIVEKPGEVQNTERY
jgi:hypothetical protein